MKSFCVTAVSLVLLISFLVVGSSKTEGGVLGVCIQNCGQCEKMYGEFFDGQECAEQCLHTLGISTPDCSKAASIRRFLGPSAKLMSARTRVEQQIPKFFVKTRVEKDIRGHQDSGCSVQ